MAPSSLVQGYQRFDERAGRSQTKCKQSHAAVSSVRPPTREQTGARCLSVGSGCWIPSDSLAQWNSVRTPESWDGFGARDFVTTVLACTVRIVLRTVVSVDSASVCSGNQRPHQTPETCADMRAALRATGPRAKGDREGPKGEGERHKNQRKPTKMHVTREEVASGAYSAADPNWLCNQNTHKMIIIAPYAEQTRKQRKLN
jgi:hypothetical protein